MKLYSMAWRNIGRNRRRSMLAMLSVGISIMMIVFMNGLITGFLGSIVKNVTKNDSGHVLVTTTGYMARERFMPVSEAIADSDALAAAILRMPEMAGKVRLATSRIRFGVVLSSGPNSKTALGVAGESETERGLLMLDRSVQPGGTYLSKRGDAILGATLAKDLGLKVGDPLKVLTQRADYGLGFKKFTVSGIFRTGVNTLDDAVFQVGIDDARELLGMGSGAQQVLVMLKDYGESGKAAAVIAAGLEKAGHEGLAVRPWTEMGDFPRFVRMAESIYVWMYAIIAFLGAFIITNIMMMVVLERKKEIGLLKSMGMPKREVLALFLIEGSLLGAIGSAVGAICGLAVNFAVSIVGMDMTAAMSSFQYPMDNVVYTSVDPIAALWIFALGTGVAAIVSLLPSRSAALMRPIDAIRSA